MPRALSSLLSVGCVALSFAAAADAGAAARTFRQASAKEFDDGEATGTAILPDGEIVPGLLAERAGVEAAFVWCATPSRDGATMYFGTGDEGKLYALPVRAAADKDGKLPAARKLATLDAAWVTALATRADGTLLAGATPGGKVWAVDPKTGGARVLGTVDATHVWALARDDKAGLTYVGTGAPGKIYALDDQGHARQLWDARDKHVVSLVRDSDGSLLAGTSESAILYRVRPDGQATALQDFEAEEVRAIVRAPSGLYVAVNDFDKAAPATGAPAPAKGTKIVLSTGGPPPSAGTLPRPGQRKARAAVYRLESDGRIEQVFALPDSYLTALVVAEDGAVLAASGADGHGFRIAADRTAALVIDVPERQALALARAGGDVWVGTGDAAGIYRARAAGGKGHYLSKVQDAEFQARWGTLHWQGAGVTFETRSGNTARPDAGWGGWKALGKDAGKEAGGGAGAIESAGARYLQYRATLGAATARLRAVTVYYLPQNQRARVTELTLADATPPATTTTTTTTPPPSRVHSATLKLRWKVENPDSDDLIYRLHFRALGDSTWRPLAGVAGDPLAKAEYDWNTDGVPDGLYVVHVMASDERVQPADRALTSDFDSTPLLIDNRKPVVRELTARYPALHGTAQDDASPVTQIEYAIDGGDWQQVSPSDGIADQLREPFAVQLPKLARGTHSVVVRATDSADNVGVADVVIKVPRHDHDAGQRHRASAPCPRRVPDGGGAAAELLRDPELPRDEGGRHRRPGLGGRSPAGRGEAHGCHDHEDADHARPQRSRRGHPGAGEGDRRRGGGQRGRAGARAGRAERRAGDDRAGR